MSFTLFTVHCHNTGKVLKALESQSIECATKWREQSLLRGKIEYGGHDVSSLRSFILHVTQTTKSTDNSKQVE